MGNMGSAYPLVEVNVSFKFEGNASISKGVIERTRIGDGRTNGRTDRPTRQSEYSMPPHFVGGIIKDGSNETRAPYVGALYARRMSRSIS